MFARVTTAYVKIEKLDEVIGIMQESVVPACKSQNGFRGIYGLTDSKTGKGLTISLWETEEDAVTNEQSGYYQQQVGKLASYYVTTPVREGYEVTSQD